MHSIEKKKTYQMRLAGSQLLLLLLSSYGIKSRAGKSERVIQDVLLGIWCVRLKGRLYNSTFFFFFLHRCWHVTIHQHAYRIATKRGKMKQTAKDGWKIIILLSC